MWNKIVGLWLYYVRVIHRYVAEPPSYTNYLFAPETILLLLYFVAIFIIPMKALLKFDITVFAGYANAGDFVFFSLVLFVLICFISVLFFVAPVDMALENIGKENEGKHPRLYAFWVHLMQFAFLGPAIGASVLCIGMVCLGFYEHWARVA